jgi:hypothetical protein
MSSRSSKWSKRIALGLGTLALVLGLSHRSSAVPTSITTIYSGNECRPGSYNVQQTVVSKNGHLRTNGDYFLSTYCPIPRANPNLPYVTVEAYFMDVTTANEENPAAKVSCRVYMFAQNSDGTTQNAAYYNNPSVTMTGVYHQSSLSVSYASTNTSSQPFWTSITDSATTPKWQIGSFVCESLTSNLAIRSYAVTESN